MLVANKKTTYKQIKNYLELLIRVFAAFSNIKINYVWSNIQE